MGIYYHPSKITGGSYENTVAGGISGRFVWNNGMR